MTSLFIICQIVSFINQLIIYTYLYSHYGVLSHLFTYCSDITYVTRLINLSSVYFIMIQGNHCQHEWPDRNHVMMSPRQVHIWRNNVVPPCDEHAYSVISLLYSALTNSCSIALCSFIMHYNTPVHTTTSVWRTIEGLPLLYIRCRYELIEVIPRTERGRLMVKYLGDMDFEVNDIACYSQWDNNLSMKFFECFNYYQMMRWIRSIHMHWSSEPRLICQLYVTKYHVLLKLCLAVESFRAYLVTTLNGAIE